MFEKIDPADVLVLMPCGCDKLAAVPPGGVRLYQLYVGPMWQTLRVRRGRVGWFQIAVLSGWYGFVSAGMYGAEPYEARLSKQKADRLIERGVLGRNDGYGRFAKGATGCQPLVEASDGLRPAQGPYRAVIGAGAGDYGRVFRAFIEGFQKHKLVNGDAVIAHVDEPSAGIGEQRSRLGRWLDELNGVH